MHDTNNPRRVAVVGGGMSGIAAAYYLARRGRSVTLFEKADHLGGLSSSFQWHDVIWDRFYHVILSTDENLLNFIEELGLSDKLFWRDTQTGFYGNGKLVPFSSTLDFIRFPFLSPWQKVRLAWGIMYASRIKDPAKLDKVFVKTWLTQVFGRRLYEQIWDPLLRSKLGAARESTSAAFIWATITRLYRARESSAKIEKMGHVVGGYHTILANAERRLRESGVRIVLNAPVESVCSSAVDDTVTVEWPQGSEKFDQALLTIPCADVLRVVRLDEDSAYEWRKKLASIHYLRVVCVSLILSRRLSPYYVTNLLDTTLPFTGVIEATNIVSPEYLGGKHLVYLPKYMPEGDETFQWADVKAADCFIAKLKRIYPDLRDEEILAWNVFREKYVQPLQEVNFLDRATGFRTPCANVYLVNTAMIYNSTLNNNAAIGLALQAVDLMIQDLDGATETPPVR